VHKLAAVVTVLAALAARAGAQGQGPLPLLSAEVRLSDFGVPEPWAILRGRVSVVDAPEGPRLVVHYLTTRASPVAPAEDPGRAAGSATTSSAAVAPDPASQKSPRLSAMWVWNTAEILSGPSEREALLKLVSDEGIDRVFLYVPAAEGLAPAAGFVPFDGSALGPLVADLRSVGAAAYALDGDPDYARPENHAGVLRTVDRVRAHNASVPPEQRFYGVRYDIEPYLQPGFQGPRRTEILSEYVSLVRDVAAVAHAGGLAVGVDIPFWLDGPHEVSGEPFEAVLDGRLAGVLDHLLPLVDDVALMAYRTFAEGPDGVVTHVAGELSRARAAGTDVFVGVETTDVLDEELYTFRGRGRVGIPQGTDAPWVVLQALDDDRVRVWLVDGERARGALLDEIDGDGRPLTYWFAGLPLPLPGSRLSFHSLGAETMRRTAAEIIERVGDVPTFRGLAYHDYRALSALLEAGRDTPVGR
jgi:hypothetical protein